MHATSWTHDAAAATMQQQRNMAVQVCLRNIFRRSAKIWRYTARNFPKEGDGSGTKPNSHGQINSSMRGQEQPKLTEICWAEHPTDQELLNHSWGRPESLSTRSFGRINFPCGFGQACSNSHMLSWSYP